MAIAPIARNATALQNFRVQLSAAGARIAICAADVIEMAAVERVAGTAVEAFGVIDSWVNSAGTGICGTLEQFQLKTYLQSGALTDDQLRAALRVAQMTGNGS